MRILVAVALASLMSCSSPLCSGIQGTGFEVPKMTCTPEFAGSYVCTSGTFFRCTPNACWDSAQDGPCMPSFEEAPKPAEGVKLCTAAREVMPDIPCDEAHVGDAWCKGTSRWQCLPELCWGANDGTQTCTTNN